MAGQVRRWLKLPQDSICGSSSEVIPLWEPKPLLPSPPNPLFQEALTLSLGAGWVAWLRAPLVVQGRALVGLCVTEAAPGPGTLHILPCLTSGSLAAQDTAQRSRSSGLAPP